VRNKFFQLIVLTVGILLISPGTVKAATYYVSKSNTSATATGSSWSTAWKDFDQINWTSILAGDTIYVDGGTTSLVYTKPLIVGKSGATNNPIKIIKSMEPNHNGQVIIDGGRTDIPGCLAIGTEPTGNYSGALPYGINIDEKSNIVVDGSEWQGLVIRHTSPDGILLRDRSTTAETANILFRNIEIHDTGNLNTYSAAVSFEGHNLTFENMKIWDNGEDGYHTPNIGVENVTIRRNWLYYTFPRFNSCRHADGMQIAHEYVNTGGTRDKINNGIYVYDSLFGPYIEHGLLFGEDTSNANRAQVRNAIVDNVTFYQGVETNGVMDYVFEQAMIDANEPRPQNWTFSNITAYRTNSQTLPVPAGSASGTVSIGHQFDIRENASTYNFSNSSYVNRQLVFGVLPGTKTNNCQFNTTGDVIGTIADPQFRNPDVNIGSDNLWSDAELMQIDLTILNPNCRGSRITTVQSLINLVNQNNGSSSPTATPIPNITSVPTVTPTPVTGNCTVANNSWTSAPILSQSGVFQIEFDATPTGNGIDSVIGLSNTSSPAFTDLAASIRFSTTGVIEARNAGVYAASTPVVYGSGQAFHFRLSVNIPTHTYSVYVTPTGQSEILLANNFAFRTEQASLTTLSFWNGFSVSGSSTICNFTLEFAAGDINHDRVLNGADMRLLLGNWWSSGICSTFDCDLNNDSKVNAWDVVTAFFKL
jgi:hypothetical protein